MRAIERFAREFVGFAIALVGLALMIAGAWIADIDLDSED